MSCHAVEEHGDCHRRGVVTLKSPNQFHTMNLKEMTRNDWIGLTANMKVSTSFRICVSLKSASSLAAVSNRSRKDLFFSTQTMGDNIIIHFRLFYFIIFLLAYSNLINDIYINEQTRLTHSKTVVINDFLCAFFLAHFEFSITNDLRREHSSITKSSHQLENTKRSSRILAKNALHLNWIELNWIVTFFVKSWMMDRFSLHSLPAELIWKYIQLGRKFQTVKNRSLIASVTLKEYNQIIRIKERRAQTFFYRSITLQQLWYISNRDPFGRWRRLPLQFLYENQSV